MGAKVLIFKVESHNNHLKELKEELEVSNMYSWQTSQRNTFSNKESASPIVILTGSADVLPSEIMLSANNIKQYKTNVLLIFIFLIVISAAKLHPFYVRN
jgi:hypothetical protein